MGGWLAHHCSALDAMPYTGWVGGGWESGREGEESHCLQVSLVSRMPEASDDGAVYPAQGRKQQPRDDCCYLGFDQGCAMQSINH